MVSIVVPEGRRLQRTGRGRSGGVGVEAHTCTRAWMLWGSTTMVLILVFILTLVRFFSSSQSRVILENKKQEGF